MTEQQLQIWDQLSRFDFDDENSTYRFSDRLAKENGWSARRTERVIAEYRRFLLLAFSAGHPVSPSEDVDQAWHLHLLYTRNYWQNLCRDTVGAELHHEPTRGGRDETSKFADWYSRTLASYHAAFGEHAPASIWPAPGGKHHNHDFQRVDTAQHWVVPKTSAMVTFAVMLVLIAVLSFATGCDSPRRTGMPLATIENPLDYRGTEFLYFYTVVGAIAVGAAILLRFQAKRTPRGTNADTPIGPYEAAYLSGGASVATRAALARLVKCDAIKVDSTGLVVSSESIVPAPLHLLEASVLRGLPVKVSWAERNSSSALGMIESDLIERGLLAPTHTRAMAFIGTLPLLALFAVGVAKVGVGISRGKSVGYLISLLIVTAIVWGILALRLRLRTFAGDHALRRMRERFAQPSLRKTNMDVYTLYGVDPMTMMVALYGVSALTEDPTLHRLRLGGEGGSTGTTGCGSSCGGGGGGGGSSCGGGGCGGCGGGGN